MNKTKIRSEIKDIENTPIPWNFHPDNPMAIARAARYRTLTDLLKQKRN